MFASFQLPVQQLPSILSTAKMTSNDSETPFLGSDYCKGQVSTLSSVLTAFFQVLLAN